MSDPTGETDPTSIGGNAPDGDLAVGGSTSGGSTGGGSTGGGSTGGGSTSGGSTGGSSSTPSRLAPAAGAGTSSNSRRVAPKWLGKKIGRFRLQALLGQGAVGRVFRAEDAILHRRVALKVIALHGTDGQINKDADQFLTEARAAAALEHPHVVQIFEAGESGNLLYIAMELLDGGSLKDLVVAGGPMDPGRACLLTADAAEALAAAHEAGIIHRDVKPANLMLTRQGRCKVTDFGLAVFTDADSVTREKAAGTPLYAAPEVIRGVSADERSDIYSLAASLYYLLVGRPPYTAKSRSEVLRKHLDEPIPDLRHVRPGLAESLVAAVERGLDKDPGKRFASAQQFARVLRVQTIPGGTANPRVPPVAASSSDPVGNATVTDLSGPATATAGSSGKLNPSGTISGTIVGSGINALTEGDLMAADADAARAVAPSDPPASLPPAPVAYATPAPARPWWTPLAAWWATPAGKVIAGAAATAIVIALAALMFTGHRSAPVAAGGAPASLVPPGTSTPQVIPPPSAPPPTPSGVVAPGDVALIPPTDVARWTAVAQAAADGTGPSVATVVGTVHRAVVSTSGRTFRLEFEGTPFQVVYFDNNGLFDRMEKRFGGPHGAGLAGKRVRVTATVHLYGKAPELIVNSPAQITVLDLR